MNLNENVLHLIQEQVMGIKRQLDNKRRDTLNFYSKGV